MPLNDAVTGSLKIKENPFKTVSFEGLNPFVNPVGSKLLRSKKPD
jgi:hypothetical protein